MPSSTIAPAFLASTNLQIGRQQQEPQAPINARLQATAANATHAQQPAHSVYHDMQAASSAAVAVLSGGDADDQAPWMLAAQQEYAAGITRVLGSLDEVSNEAFRVIRNEFSEMIELQRRNGVDTASLLMAIVDSSTDTIAALVRGHSDDPDFPTDPAVLATLMQTSYAMKACANAMLETMEPLQPGASTDGMDIAGFNQMALAADAGHAAVAHPLGMPLNAAHSLPSSVAASHGQHRNEGEQASVPLSTFVPGPGAFA
ncbi:MAG: hypothetical protein ABWY08_08875 [Comamonas sp.]